MKQFYIDLMNWIEIVNKKSQELDEVEYFKFVFWSSEKLNEKYNKHPLVDSVILAHLNYLVALSDGDKYPF